MTDVKGYLKNSLFDISQGHSLTNVIINVILIAQFYLYEQIRIKGFAGF